MVKSVRDSIFREYDVRGKYPSEINEKIAHKIGGAFVIFLKLKPGDKVIVGRDKRPSSPKLAEAVISTLLNYGIKVLDTGVVTTPIFYYSVIELKVKGGIMITASHNPKNQNGMKFVKEKAMPISGEEIGAIIGKISAPTKNAKKESERKKIDTEERYMESIFQGEKIPKKSKVNASFDYDEDRLMIKDKKGNQIRGDIIGGIIADKIVRKGETVIYDLRCSHAIPKYLQNKGIVAIPSRVGHVNMKKTMAERNAAFGMEMTGHYFFKKHNFMESPLYALKILSDRIDNNKEKLEDLMLPFRKYHHSGIIDLKIKNSKNIFEKLKEKYRNGAHSDLDGLSIEFSNWWFNLRPSKTESNIFRLVVEANTKEMMEERVKELKNLLNTKQS